MKKLFLIVVSLTLFLSCNDDDDARCISYADAYAESVEAIETADALGFPFKVYFKVLNGCGNFDSFKQTVSGNTITIQTVAKYEGCICTEDVPLRDAVYNFQPTVPGTYTLRFLTSNDTFITETVTLQ